MVVRFFPNEVSNFEPVVALLGRLDAVRCAALCPVLHHAALRCAALCHAARSAK